MLILNASNVFLTPNLEFSICASLYPWSNQLSSLTEIDNCISAGASSFKLAVIEAFSDNALDSTHIVTNSIRQIIVIENTVVFILLLTCLSVNVLSPFTYKFFIPITIFSISPDNDQNRKNVATAPIMIGFIIPSGVCTISFTPPVTR